MTTDLRALAADTLRILETGRYRAPRGGTVEIAAALRTAIDGTRLYEPADPLPAGPPVDQPVDPLSAGPVDQPVDPLPAGPPVDQPADPLPAGAPVDRGSGPVVSVTGESTLAAARRLSRDGDVAALVFASAKHPGGGFRTGARAQEEDIARASGLYRCLNAAPRFYTAHRSRSDNLYSDRVIHSRGVPVFRDDDGNLLDEPYPVSFLTAAAPNRGAVPRDRAAQVAQVLTKRARRVLAVATAHGHRRLVLGAWGCGVFRNDPATVAEAFAGALAEQAAHLDLVVFAIMDRAGSATRAEFDRRFP